MKILIFLNIIFFKTMISINNYLIPQILLKKFILGQHKYTFHK